jgi:hypothetical protein
MARALILTHEQVREVRRDPRFRAAIAGRLASTEWRAAGRCLRHDPELFFPSSADDPRPALAICGGCPVSAPCLAAALDIGDCDGVWGATTADERRAMRQVWVQTVPAGA